MKYLGSLQNLEEGQYCPNCGGLVLFKVPENCSCHISPPCWACIESRPECKECGCDSTLDKQIISEWGFMYLTKKKG